MIGRVISVVLLVGSAIGLYNVYGDNTEVVEEAKRRACSAPVCDAKITRESRSPIGQSFTIQTRVRHAGAPPKDESVDVECQRAFYLLGDYSCARR